MTIGLLAFVGGTLVEEALAMSCLLLFESSLLINMTLAGCRLEAVVLVLSQGIDCALPILEGAFCKGASPKKNEPPGQFQRQQAGGLLVFAKCSLGPIFIVKGTTNIGRGIEFLKTLNTQLGARGGGCDHLYCSHPEGSEREDEGK